jgi:hypothetical protein
MFTESCLYDLKDEDQWDVNKLFGFSIGMHHKISFRFGWRSILETKEIEIVAYEYYDGVRQVTKIIDRVGINEWHRYILCYYPLIQKVVYYISGAKKGLTTDVKIKKKWGWGYTLGLYFGGNDKAPQKIVIYSN